MKPVTLSVIQGHFNFKKLAVFNRKNCVQFILQEELHCFREVHFIMYVFLNLLVVRFNPIICVVPQAQSATPEGMWPHFSTCVPIPQEILSKH